MQFEIALGQMVLLPVEFPELSREVALMTRTGALLSPAALTLLDVIRGQSS
jgi:hypothetical protein